MQDSTIFTGRNQIPYWYSVYNAKRSSGIHRGVDICGLDDTTIHCPVAGTVARTTVITNRADPTWEWGWYVRVDDPAGNKHYFCHCTANSFAVTVGQTIAAGTPLARMGCSGNAAQAVPPLPHVHYEVRTTAGTWLNPCTFLPFPNAVGIYGSTYRARQVRVNTEVLRVRTGPSTEYEILQNVQNGEIYTLLEEKHGWGYSKMLGGWICLEYTATA